MFELLEFAEARLATVTSRIERHGEEERPAVSIGLELTAANTILDLIDPKIREALYKPVDGQDGLPGIEISTPVLRCNSFDKHTLPTRYEGWTLEVDDGIDDTEPMKFGGAKIDKFSVEAKQGGSVVLRFRVGTSDLDAKRSGMLGMHVGQPIWITLHAPKPGDERQIDETLPEPDATDLFAGDTDAEEGETEDVETETEAPAPAPAPAPAAAAKQVASRRGKAKPKGDWPFGDQGDDNKPAADATDAFIAAQTH